MTKEEFKAEILKANPQAVFIERKNGDLECTETEILVGSAQVLKEVYGFSSEGFAKTETAEFRQISAPSPKKKRLMTPAECAGKWTCKDGERVLVCGYRGDHITTAHAVTSTVKELHERGWMIADTPTSQPRSMEIES